VEDLKNNDYEEEIKRRSKRIFIPNWFTVDLKTGVNLPLMFSRCISIYMLLSLLEQCQRHSVFGLSVRPSV